MLKKIKVQDAQVGMYVHEICSSWMDNPFWKKSFKLTKEKDLQALSHYQIKEVWIDTDKGMDVHVEAQSVTVEEEKLQINNALQEIAAQVKNLKPRASLQDELVRARKILGEAKKAVISMFNEVRMGNAIKIDQAADLVDEINQSITRNPDALLSIVRLKNANNYTYLHSIAVSGLMMALGKEMGMDNATLKEVGMAGLLHDIGKIYVPSKILNKTGRLTDEEFAIMRTHPQKGWEQLKLSDEVGEIALDVCLHHHERVDGKGYPDQLSGDALSLYARMGAICDVYDAITSTRCYKASWEPAESLRKMAEWKDGQFDTTLFSAFVKTIGIYPSGTLVKLKSGRLGVVTEQSEASLLKPVVKVFFSTNSMAHIMPQMVDLSKSPDSIISKEDSQHWGFDLEKITAI
ncbi:MAG: HD-GYP domain-containing protein [Methylovulum sp.]|nr:HD-GYP domain-containing protein [Methylovulum sp.]